MSTPATSRRSTSGTKARAKPKTVRKVTVQEARKIADQLRANRNK